MEHYGLNSYADVCNHPMYERYWGVADYEEEPSEYEKYCNYLEELEGTLKPCGRCGEEELLYLVWDEETKFKEESFFVECQECATATPCYKSPEEAVETWNTRVYVA